MILLILLMSMAVITDIRFYKIPNLLIITGLLLGVAIRYRQDGFAGILSMLFSIGLLIAFLFPFFIMHGLGAGDIKLFCMMTAYFHQELFWQCFVLTFLIAAGMAIGKMCCQGTFFYKIRKLYYYCQFIVLTQEYREYETKEYMRAKENRLRMSIPALISVLIMTMRQNTGGLL